METLIGLLVLGGLAYWFYCWLREDSERWKTAVFLAVVSALAGVIFFIVTFIWYILAVLAVLAVAALVVVLISMWMAPAEESPANGEASAAVPAAPALPAPLSRGAAAAVLGIPETAREEEARGMFLRMKRALGRGASPETLGRLQEAYDVFAADGRSDP